MLARRSKKEGASATRDNDKPAEPDVRTDDRLIVVSFRLRSSSSSVSASPRLSSKMPSEMRETKHLGSTMAPSENTPLLLVNVAPPRHRYPHHTLRRICTFSLSLLLIIALILFLIPTAVLPREHGSIFSYFPGANPYPHASWPHGNGLSYEELQAILQNTPSAAKEREWSSYYTSGPHLAGKNLSQAVWTKERWQELGVEDTSIVAYDIYLNYPVDHRLALLKKSGDSTEVTYEATLEEDVLEKDHTSGLADRVPTFHGYSASGNVTAPFVYVNFGTVYDFQDLVDANVSLTGKIAIAKYGRIFRGLKVKRAQELGMVGVILYDDPESDGDITEENGYKPYPDGPARNPTAVQRGSAQFLSKGFHNSFDIMRRTE